MKKFMPLNETEIFTTFNPKTKFYAGKISNDVVELIPSKYRANTYIFRICGSNTLNCYDLAQTDGFTIDYLQKSNLDIRNIFEFETAKEMYQWIADNL